MMAGSLTWMVSRPPSISRVTVAWPSAITTLEAKVACGQLGQRGQHLAGLVAVVVDGLFAEDDEAGLFFVDQRLEQLGHGQRLQLVVGFDQDGAVGTDGHGGAQGLLALR